MATEAIPFTTRDAWLAHRLDCLTSTEVSALFGINPWLTKYELYWQKKDRIVVDLDPSERMEWGLLLQDVVAKRVATEQGWTIRRMDEFLVDRAARMGSSFDFALVNPISQAILGLLEVKTVDGLQYQRGWIVDKESGEVESPPHIELQVQHQLLVSGQTVANIACLVGGNKLVLLKREADLEVHAAIRAEAAKFWALVDAGTPPVPDFARDAEFIGKLMGYAEPGKVIEAPDGLHDLMLAWQQSGKELKAIEERRDAIKAKTLLAIGDAEKVYGDGWTLSAGLVGPAHVEYDREGYRAFRPSFKKGHGAA